MNYCRRFNPRQLWWHRAAIIFTIAIVAGCDSNQPAVDRLEVPDNSVQVDVSTPTEAPEMKREKLVLKSGTVADYALYIPEGYVADQPRPLILGLHFGGRAQPAYGQAILDALVIPGLGELGAIMVAPVSIDGRWNTDANQAAIFEILDYVESQYSIDSDRVLVTGFSMGGQGTWDTAAANQQRFSAAIPVAGRIPANPDIQWEIPLYIINSKADEVIPFEMAKQYAEDIEADGANVTFHAVDDLPHFQTGRFSVPLKEAVPWVREIWGLDSLKEDSASGESTDTTSGQ
ncbi:MAG: dienelactone hydrolase family protein [Planctomycetota bacterium]